MLQLLTLTMVSAKSLQTNSIVSPILNSVLRSPLLKGNTCAHRLWFDFLHPTNNQNYRFIIPSDLELSERSLVDQTLKTALPIFWAAPLQELTHSQDKFRLTLCPIGLKNLNCQRLKEISEGPENSTPEALRSARHALLARVVDEMFWCVTNVTEILSRRAEVSTMEQDDMERYIEELDFSTNRYISYLLDNYVHYVYILTSTPARVLEFLKEFNS